MAIVDRPVSLVEKAGAVQEVAQARPFEAVFPPLDLGRRTAPGLALENWPVALCEFAVEARVMGNDNHGVVCERRDGYLVDPLSCHHFVRDARKRGDLWRDRFGRLVERRKDISETRDTAVRQVIELDHPELDHLVLPLVEACRLHVDQNGGLRALAERWDKSIPRSKATEHAVVARIGQCLRHCGQSYLVFKHGLPLSSGHIAHASGLKTRKFSLLQILKSSCGSVSSSPCREDNDTPKRRT